MRYRTEFRVMADVCFPRSPGSGILTPGDPFIELINGRVDKAGNVTDLVGRVIADGSGLHEARDEHRALLAAHLDLLALSTHMRFQILEPLRCIEWDEGLRDRQMLLFIEQDARQPPSPRLESDLLRTVEAIAAREIPAFAVKALKYFRYGLLERQPEDQFVRFWQALEIIVENTKSKDPVAVTCGKCRAPMVCQCGAQAVRTPMATDATRELIARLSGDQEVQLAKVILRARNTLMHGGEASSVENKTGWEFGAIVNATAEMAYRAICEIVLPRDVEITLASRGGDYSNGTMTVAQTIGFSHEGDGPQPADNDIPSLRIEIAHKFP